MSMRIVREAVWRVPWLALRGTVPPREIGTVSKVEAKP
jgi:hypothetical protein